MSPFFTYSLDFSSEKMLYYSMAKNKPQTKEQLIYYMANKLSLGTYDRRFIANLLVLTTEKKPVTSGQSELLAKLIVRYRKQFVKYELDVHDLDKLPWSIDPIISSAEYTNASLRLVNNDTCILKAPYKKEFAKKVKRLSWLEWENTNKIWEFKLSPYTLKIVNKLVNMHFDSVNYCSKIKILLDSVVQYQNFKYWDPTLTRINGNLYIIATNKHLDAAIADIKLDTELNTISTLVRYGIKIDDSIVKELSANYSETEIEFARGFVVTFEVTEPLALVKNLININADYVVIINRYSAWKEYIAKLKKELTKKEIKLKHLTTNKNEEINVKDVKYPVLIMDSSSYLYDEPLSSSLFKVINLTKST